MNCVTFYDDKHYTPCLLHTDIHILAKPHKIIKKLVKSDNNVIIVENVNHFFMPLEQQK